MWTIKCSPRWERDLRKCEKKHQAELANALQKLDTYFRTLQAGVDPRQVDSVRYRTEASGVIAFDERGPKRRSSERGVGGKQVTAAVRLYALADPKTQSLWVLAIGDKSSQASDIRYCSSFVKSLKADGSSTGAKEPED